MNKKIMKLDMKISLLVIIIVFFSISISMSAIGYWSIHNMTENLKNNLLNVVNITKLSPTIIQGLENPKEENSEIQKFLTTTQNQLPDIDVMVVADKNGRRYGHTVMDRVGNPFSALDHEEALKKGTTYVSVGPGTLGDSMRAFAPIKNSNDEIIGFVMAGSLLTSIEVAKKNITIKILLFLFFGVVLGILGALYVSRTIKKSLLGFEPDFLARLYSENKVVLESIREGVIAINEQGIITLANERTSELLGIDSEKIVGRKIQEIFPESKLPEVLGSKEAILDYQYHLNDVVVNSNNLPIIDNGKIIGGVSSFRDQTEMLKLSQDLTGVQKVVDSLRATTHEFKNKLHVILGYIESDRIEMAINYISDVDESIQNSVSHILQHIKEPTLSALLIGKVNRGYELKINVELDDSSYFENKYKININNLVVIVGNLIDNSIENLNELDKEDKRVRIEIKEAINSLMIKVEDNGSGIEDTSKIFHKGFSTKMNGRGYGLYLLRNNVEVNNGKIQVVSGEEGSTFTITFKKGEQDYDKSISGGR